MKRSFISDNILQVELSLFRGNISDFKPHFHLHYLVGLIKFGSRLLTVKNKEVLLKKGDILLLNQNEVHSCKSVNDETFEFIGLNLTSSVIKKYAKNEIEFCQNIVKDSALADVIQVLAYEILNNKTKRKETFLKFMKGLIEKYSKPLSSKKEDLKQALAIEFLKNHYFEKITIEKLSEICALNKSSFIRSFQKETGITPYKYLENIRIEKAKELLLCANSLTKTSLECGFSDYSHFTRFFKQFYGITPNEYKLSKNKGN